MASGTKQSHYKMIGTKLLPSSPNPSSPSETVTAYLNQQKERLSTPYYFTTKFTEGRLILVADFAQKHIKNTNKIHYAGWAVKILITPRRAETL